MTLQIKIPSVGESITTASIAQWHCQSGSLVKKGEVLVTIETDKVSSELEAPESGILTILLEEGVESPIGEVIATLEPKEFVDSEDKESQTEELLEPKEIQEKEVEVSKQEETNSKAIPPQEEVSSERLPVTRKKMSMLRKKIATHLVNAQQTAAILTTFNEVDMTEIIEIRKQVKDEFIDKYDVKLGFMSFFIKAVTKALQQVPQMNSQIQGDEIIENHYYDISVAIGAEKGLIVPVIRSCDQKNFATIEKDLLRYAQKAKEGKIKLEDLEGGVFTISNGGIYGSLLSTPILNPPQSGILGMHSIQQRPIAVDGKVVIRPMMYLALSYDHRMVDGREAVSFLIKIKELIEHPAALLID